MGGQRGHLPDLVVVGPCWTPNRSPQLRLQLSVVRAVGRIEVFRVHDVLRVFGDVLLGEHRHHPSRLFGEVLHH